MDETMKNATTEEIEEQEIVTDETAEKDPLKEAIEKQMRNIQRQSMLIGAQTMCRVVLEKILTFKSKQGKPTMNDYKRLVKDVQNFCETGISRKIDANGEPVMEEEPAAEETVQN